MEGYLPLAVDVRPDGATVRLAEGFSFGVESGGSVGCEDDGGG
jgi:hypothetical protein